MTTEILIQTSTTDRSDTRHETKEALAPISISTKPDQVDANEPTTIRVITELANNNDRNL